MLVDILLINAWAAAKSDVVMDEMFGDFRGIERAYRPGAAIAPVRLIERLVQDIASVLPIERPDFIRVIGQKGVWNSPSDRPCCDKLHGLQRRAAPRFDRIDPYRIFSD